MKKRNGFVSNSSSSSFIISDMNYPTVKDLAKYMIGRLEYDTNEILETLESLDDNQPVSFPSCNYDTFIKKINDSYFVSTCNNEDWDLWGDCERSVSAETCKELENIRSTFKKNTDDYDNLTYVLDKEYGEIDRIGCDYYDLDKKIIGVETYNSCPKCGEYMWDMPQYKKICLKCDPRLKRQEKLEKLKEIENEKT